MRRFAVVGGLIVGELLCFSLSALAQITPDSSLGAESSRITPNVQFGDDLIDRIDGGSVRSDALFHSFSDFNVNEAQQVYFNNPADINHIFSRVTGVSQSSILGTLGVLGDANLYLINPNGILFGDNAQLDVRGTFVGTTASGVEFTNGEVFSATAPTTAPLLTLNDPLGLASWLPTPTGSISSTANLATGQDLTLMANTLDLTGQLEANGDLTLQASDTLTVNDAANQPFIATAGNTLLLQGDNALSINALAHPDSGLFSGSDMILRSDGTVIGDAHYFANGNFRVEQVDGSPGSLSSPNDPVIRASGDVLFNSYVGASLHILAGGSVTIGAVTITGPDTVGNSLQEDVTLSNGDVIAIDGSAEPTLDIRAGTTAFNPSGITPAAPADFFDPGVPVTNGVASGADIDIDFITTSGGLVFLTNQYEPIAGVIGDITAPAILTADFLGGGDVVVDSSGGLTFQFIDVSGGDAFFFNIAGNSGNIMLLADGDIVMPFELGQSLILSYGIDSGDIVIASKTSIEQEAAPPGTDAFDTSFIDSLNLGTNPGGGIFLTAPEISLGGGGAVTTFGEGDSGSIVINAENSLTFANETSVFTDTFGDGNSGDITINAGDVLLINTFLGTSTTSPGSILGKGNAGDLEINANNLTLTAGAFAGSLITEFGVGNAGDVILNVEDTVSLNEGAILFSSANSDTVGNSGDLMIDTSVLSLTEGSQVTTSAFSMGDAGQVVINASELVVIDGAVGELFPSAIASEVSTDATGQGGDINLTTAVLTVTNGGTITASTDGDGDAGSVTIDATESATFDGIGPFDRVSSVGVIADENTTGVAGTLTVETPFLQVLNGAEITAETLGGTGTGGNLIIRADELRLENQASLTAETVNTDGGNITLDVGPLLLLRNGSEITATAGENANFGNGGNIAINMPDGFIVAVLDEDSNIEANAFLGDGGNVDIVAQGLFGIEFQENSTLQSDITASSDFGLQGSVTIETPDVDPSKDLATLPTDLVDASRLVAQGCGDSDIATSLGEFTITGRGGLPPTPEQLTAQTSLAEWETLDMPEQVQSSAQPIDSELESRTIQQIEEFQGWIVNDRGDVVLTADADTAIPRSPWQPAVQCRTQS